MFVYKIFALVFVASIGSFSAVTANELFDPDHDGVLGDQDKCPNTPLLRKVNKSFKYSRLFSSSELSDVPVSVPVDVRGCALDTDGDGVADYLDYCPDNTPLELSKGINRNGCSLQSDGDGTPDYRDKCPNTKRGVKADRFGCPI